MKIICQNILNGLYKAVLFKNRKPKLFRYFKIKLNGIHIICYDYIDYIETVKKREYHKEVKK